MSTYGDTREHRDTSGHLQILNNWASGELMDTEGWTPVDSDADTRELSVGTMPAPLSPLWMPPSANLPAFFALSVTNWFELSKMCSFPPSRELITFQICSLFSQTWSKKRHPLDYTQNQDRFKFSINHSIRVVSKYKRNNEINMESKW